MYARRPDQHSRNDDRNKSCNRGGQFKKLSWCHDGCPLDDSGDDVAILPNAGASFKCTRIGEPGKSGVVVDETRDRWIADPAARLTDGGTVPSLPEIKRPAR